MIEIKSWNGRVLYTAENAQDVRAAVREAVKAGANLSRADLSGANLSRANLYGADLSRADLSRANLSRADLSGANLSRANLSGADLSGANLSRANLSWANLSRANLSWANLSRANLYGADLSRANLYGADLSRANLSRANLSGADLSGANLSRANLSGADLSRARGITPHQVNDLLILLDQPGKIRAYKLVAADGGSPIQTGNRIIYEVGKSYEVKNASTAADVQCAAGINLATLPWCLREYRPGYRILLAEFKASDIAAIPIGDGKFRVHKCRIVRELDVSKFLPAVPDEAVRG